MAYTAEISRENPSCIFFLIDQSQSMAGPFGGESGGRKADRLAVAINGLLYELAIGCTKDQTEGVRDYYAVGVVGYGARIGPAFAGQLAERDLVPISEVANNPARVEERKRKEVDDVGHVIEIPVKFPVWFDPVTDNGTPMCQALQYTYSILESWVQAHSNSFPPIVINITDGEATDGDPRQPAEALRNLATNDGNLLLFNLHVSSHSGTPISYPHTDSGLPDEYARQLFQMSSVLPPHTREAAVMEGYAIGPQPRGFVFNADMVEVITFLEIGTRPRALG